MGKRAKHWHIIIHGGILYQHALRERNLDKKRKVGKSDVSYVNWLPIGRLVWPYVVAVPRVVVRIWSIVWDDRIPWIPVRDFHLHGFHCGIHLLQPASIRSPPQLRPKNTHQPAAITVGSKSRTSHKCGFKSAWKNTLAISFD